MNRDDAINFILSMNDCNKRIEIAEEMIKKEGDEEMIKKEDSRVKNINTAINAADRYMEKWFEVFLKCIEPERSADVSAKHADHAMSIYDDKYREKVSLCMKNLDF